MSYTPVAPHESSTTNAGESTTTVGAHDRKDGTLWSEEGKSLSQSIPKTPRSQDLYERSRNLDVLMSRVRRLGNNNDNLGRSVMLTQKEKSADLRLRDVRSRDSKLANFTPSSQLLSKGTHDIRSFTSPLAFRKQDDSQTKTKIDYSPKKVLSFNVTPEFRRLRDHGMSLKSNVTESPVEALRSRNAMKFQTSDPFLNKSVTSNRAAQLVSKNSLLEIRESNFNTNCRNRIDESPYIESSRSITNCHDVQSRVTSDENLEITSLHQEIASLRTQLAIAKGYRVTNNEITKRLDKAKEHNKELEEKLTKQNSDLVSKLHEQEERLRKESTTVSEELDASLKTKRAEVLKLQAQLDSQKQKYEVELQQRDKDIERHRMSFEKVQKEFDKVKISDENIGHAKYVEELQNQLHDAVNLCAVYRKELDNVTTILKNHEKDRRLGFRSPFDESDEGEIIQDSDNRKVFTGKLLSENKALRLEIETMSKTMRSLTEILKEKEEDIALSNKALLDLCLCVGCSNGGGDIIVAVNGIKDSFETLSSTYNKVNQENSTLKIDLATGQDKLISMTQELQLSRKAVADFEPIQQAALSNINKFKSQVETLTNENSKLQLDLEEAAAAHKLLEEFEQVAAECQADAGRAQENMLSKVNEVEDLKRKLKEAEEELTIKIGEVAILKESIPQKRNFM